MAILNERSVIENRSRLAAKYLPSNGGPLPGAVNKQVLGLGDWQTNEAGFLKSFMPSVNSENLGTMTSAILRSGTTIAAALVPAVAATSALARPVTLYRFGFNGLWDHSAECAIWAQALAEEFDLWDSDVAYLAGLLHDIGLPALETFARDRTSIGRLIRSAEYPSFVAEQMVLGFDHANLGSLICQNWSFPREIVAAVAAHHEPFEDETPSRLAAILHVADAIAMIPDVDSHNPFYVVSADPDVLEWLGLRMLDLRQLATHLRSSTRHQTNSAR